MMRKIISIVILIVVITSSSLNVCIAASTVDRQRRAVIATAEAYYMQNDQLQYDSYKKNLTATPEDATSKHSIYTVCSGFVYMSYRQALGEDLEMLDDLETTKSIMKYAATADKNDVIFYYDSSDDLYAKNISHAQSERKRHLKGDAGANLVVEGNRVSDESKKIFISRLFDDTTNGKGVLPGDIFVYGKGDIESESFAGHAMLVYDVDVKNKKIYLIEAGGASLEGEYGRYDVENHIDKIEPDGAVHNTEANKKILLEDRLYPDKTHMCLIRIIPEVDSADNKTTITDSALMRLRYPEIDIGKVITQVNKEKSKINQTYASLGDTLSFKITIRNKSTQDYKYPLCGEESINVYNQNGEIVKNAQYNFSIDGISVDIQNAKKTIVTNKYNASFSIEIDEETGVLKWSMNNKGLVAGDALIIEYDVKIDQNDSELNGKFISFEGNVKQAKMNQEETEPRACIATSKIETAIGKKLSTSQSEELTSRFMHIYNKTVNGREFTTNQKLILSGATSGRKFIEQLYAEVLGIDLGITEKETDSTDVKKFIYYDKALKDPEESISRYASVDSGLKYLYSNFYGLRLTDQKDSAYLDGGVRVKASQAWDSHAEFELMDRARTLNKDMLINGDVILNYTEKDTKQKSKTEMNKEMANKAYIYFDGTLYRFRNNDGKISFETITGSKLNSLLNNMVGEHYIILRPYMD